MKKIWCCMMVLLVTIGSAMPVYAQTQQEYEQAIHETFADYSVDDLLKLRSFIDFELKDRASTNETATRDIICHFFESQGLAIQRVLFQPLVEKDDGLYGGMERWWITFETGEQITAWVKDGKITYCYGGQEFDEVPLY